MFVGSNQAGKTSILEAAELVAMGTASGLLRGPRRRGESTWVVKEEGTPSRLLDLSHLFHGHALQVGAIFEIYSGASSWVRCEVTESEPYPTTLFHAAEESGPALLFSSSSEEKSRQISPSLPDPMPGPALLSPPRSSSRPVHFLGTDAVLASQLGPLWDTVVLTPEEEKVVAAIRIVEPDIERIAFLGEGRDASSILLKSAGTEQRHSLASAGSGLKRLLTLALHLSAARGGYLLVDEIDTGLHHTVMVDMWRLVIETAKRLGVQVFATTYSLDCVRALGWAQEKNAGLANEAMLHRIEPGLPSTVRYTLDELVIAAEHHLEVR